MCECSLPQQPDYCTGLSLAERAEVVDDRDKVAARGPIAGVVAKGLLVLNGPVGMDPKSSFRLRGEVVLQQRPHPDHQTLELSALRSVETGR